MPFVYYAILLATVPVVNSFSAILPGASMGEQSASLLWAFCAMFVVLGGALLDAALPPKRR